MKKNNKSRNNGLLPNSFRIISSCLKTVSTNASTVASTVRNAAASAASPSSSNDHRDQVMWAGFDILELGPSTTKHVLLLGYQNGFQVLDVEDASNVSELLSKRDGTVTFLQMQPFPLISGDEEGFKASHPLLLVVARDEASIGLGSNHILPIGPGRDDNLESQSANFVNSPTAVRFYSLKSHSYVHILRFRSAVCMVRCSRRIVAIALASQIYCFDALTLVNKFSVLTHPVPQLGGGILGVNIGHGPMAVGPRWIAYAPNNPMSSNSGRLSPQNLTSSPGISPSTSPSSGTLMACYAVESSKQLASGIINLGDKGYKTLSKYYQELLPDALSSPALSSSGAKVNKLPTGETYTAGMVVVRDFVSRDVISQFKAHTSPISVLCFDPSGTLLVTASVCGHNINVFRILPSCTQNGSGAPTYNWKSSHVHLYKLHRGISPAIIQDICFSHYSQWIAIVSSKGTCHIYFLSPFGGDTGFQAIQADEPFLFPATSLPWWSTSLSILRQESLPPPSPVTLSVVSRLRNSDSGWLGTVSNVAAAATGKTSVPSGAVSAAFHNSLFRDGRCATTKLKSFEHLLIYTPSGYVVQHELMPSISVEQSDGSSRVQSSSYAQKREDELGVKIEPVQWWDVCRRSDWPEREENITHRHEMTANFLDKANNSILGISNNISGKKLVSTESSKSHEKSGWYLSNAEIQGNFGKSSIWQNSKISFFVMGQPRENIVGGEFEIEKIPAHEVQIKWKDLLPVFDYFHSIKLSWNDRGFSVSRSSSGSFTEAHQSKAKFTEETVICHSNPASLSSTESSDGGSSRRIDNLIDLDQLHFERTNAPNCQVLDEFPNERSRDAILEPALTSRSCDHAENGKMYAFSLLSDRIPVCEECLAESISDLGCPQVSILNAESHSSTLNSLIDEKMLPATNKLVDFRQSYEEEYCKVSDLNGCNKADTSTDDVDSSKSNENCEKMRDGDVEGENDGMFAFSEEGS